MTLYRANDRRIVCDKHRRLSDFGEPIDEEYAKTYTYGCEYCYEEKLPENQRCPWYQEEVTIIASKPEFFREVLGESIPYDEYIERYDLEKSGA